ncbi:hypothetical protein N7474_002469 [Penicillium riverlandense]|uniref:uncharacterized protein n=1 Tax=Penicillium riverlandense TaxID=1903569 RepID=UPI0025483B59|nr:uncharacterized protein N7474_002469 [Penicillium riverlandense]KAJ5825331.1 hypothetical protein N7474_002469 [Penicillium riverlandense]
MLHKLALLFKTVLAPELIAVEGFQEWAQCRRMETDCVELTNGQFGLIHAFYISMLALRYRTPKGDRVIWPNQYTWLLRQRLIIWEDHASWGLSLENIRDKSKADNAAKFIAFIQVFWFVAQCILRAAYYLPLSQLEAMTLGYIPMFVVTYFFWWDKPKDIRSPSIVELPDMSEEQRHAFELMAVSNKFDNEGMRDQVTLWNIWYLTPRVFEKEEEEKAIRDAQSEGAQRAAKMVAEIREKNQSQGIPQETTIFEDDIQRFEGPQFEIRKEVVLAQWDPRLYKSKLWPLTCLFGSSFGALHLACWNTVFPTLAEMWLWRVSALVSILSMLVFMHFEKVVFRWGGPLTIISIASPGLYMLSRVFMMGEVFTALRAEDPTIYCTYQVSTYLADLLSS